MVRRKPREATLCGNFLPASRCQAEQRSVKPVDVCGLCSSLLCPKKVHDGPLVLSHFFFERSLRRTWSVRDLSKTSSCVVWGEDVCSSTLELVLLGTFFFRLPSTVLDMGQGVMFFNHRAVFGQFLSRPVELADGVNRSSCLTNTSATDSFFVALSVHAHMHTTKTVTHAEPLTNTRNFSIQ